MEQGTNDHFARRAQQVFTRAGGDPANTVELAQWARDTHASGDSRDAVLVGEDGRLLAQCRTGSIATYATTGLVPEATAIISPSLGLEVGRAAAQLTRETGRAVILVRYSDVCTGQVR